MLKSNLYDVEELFIAFKNLTIEDGLDEYIEALSDHILRNKTSNEKSIRSESMNKYDLETELLKCSDNLITFEAFINNAHQNGFTFSIVPNNSTGNINLIATDQNKKEKVNE